MLVLSRQRDETIMISDEIEITIVDIRGDKVRIGITAPTRIAVHRKEVYEAIKREDAQAAQFNARIQNGDLEVLKNAVSASRTPEKAPETQEVSPGPQKHLAWQPARDTVPANRPLAN